MQMVSPSSSSSVYHSLMLLSLLPHLSIAVSLLPHLSIVPPSCSSPSFLIYRSLPLSLFPPSSVYRFPHLSIASFLLHLSISAPLPHLSHSLLPHLSVTPSFLTCLFPHAPPSPVYHSLMLLSLTCLSLPHAPRPPSSPVYHSLMLLSLTCLSLPHAPLPPSSSVYCFLPHLSIAPSCSSPLPPSSSVYCSLPHAPLVHLIAYRCVALFVGAHDREHVYWVHGSNTQRTNGEHMKEELGYIGGRVAGDKDL